ncbi:MAG: HIT family protein [Candidatus Kapaibacterium sp.]
MMECLFCKIIAGKEKAWVVYEDEHHVAFLTPFPNTPGFTVLVTREHLGSYVSDMESERYTDFLKTAKTLAHHLDTKLGTKRTGFVIEGMGIDHAHIKLIPMHGIPEGDWKPILSREHTFRETYEGYLTTNDGPRMSDEELDEIQKKIAS